MSEQHIQSIRRRRAEIQQLIEAEQSSANPQWARIAHLKKVRLRLKERLERALADASRFIDGPRAAPAAELRRRHRQHFDQHS